MSKARLRVRMLDVSIAIVGGTSSCSPSRLHGPRRSLGQRVLRAHRQLALGGFLVILFGYLGASWFGRCCAR